MWGHIVRDAISFVPATDIENGAMSPTFMAPALRMGEVSDKKILSSCLNVVTSWVVMWASKSSGYIEAVLANLSRGVE